MSNQALEDFKSHALQHITEHRDNEDYQGAVVMEEDIAEEVRDDNSAAEWIEAHETDRNCAMCSGVRMSVQGISW